MNEKFVGKRRFTDGEVRVVYRDECGQFVLDEDLEPVYGVWIFDGQDAVDEPVVVEQGNQ
jgi:hypothetical protein